ncbi:sigma-54-dependent transcriptional regulator [Magnetococcus sp. PR-3]|uniref:sigma-54-dependent transcriptional regulator n=1 Tax=Magnetococcus sp. PR-3 TaxID=3120355 RepID=UPI002FCDF987
MPLKKKILIVDDDRLFINLLADLLEEQYDILVAKDGHQALQIVKQTPPPDLVLLDIQMPQMDGFEFCQNMKNDSGCQEIPIIFITARSTPEEESKGFKAGAVDFITKPFSPEVVRVRIALHLSQQRMIKQASELQALRCQIKDLTSSAVSHTLAHPQAFRKIITHHPVMFRLFHYMEAICQSGEPVLISGETGVGKEQIAETLHLLSGRKGKLISVNMAGLDDTTFADTLFGHKRGAFTSADKERKGLVAEAAGGTLFLDELGDLSLASQVKLLRLLQEKVYFPLGSDQPLKANVYIVAATNKSLDKAMEAGSFRQDLFYRLASHQIQIPPLRERKEDLVLLTQHFVNEAFFTLSRPAPELPPELIKLLKTYHFPGNIRELRGLLFNAAALHGDTPFLSMESIKATIHDRLKTAPQMMLDPITSSDPQQLLSITPDGPLPTLAVAEEVLVREALKRTARNQGAAAKLLGISRQALSRRLQGRLKHLKKTL